MNIQDGFLYATAASDDRGKIDARLACWVAALDQNRRYGIKEPVNGQHWWNARCQLGMLVGLHFVELHLLTPIPCGKDGKLAKAGMAKFTDPKYKPSKATIEEALRKLKLMRQGIALFPTRPPALDDRRVEHLVAAWRGLK